MSAQDDIKAAIDIHKTERGHGFTAGFCIACVELAKTHGEDVLAGYLLKEAGISFQRAQDIGLDQDDLDVIKLLTEPTQ